MSEPCKGVRVDDRNAVVTGAGSGIGRAIALALSHDGMQVHLVGRDPEKLRQVAVSARAPTRIIATDLTSAGSIARLAAGLPERLHCLVHSAGSYARGPVGTLDAEGWAALDSINVYAPMLLTSACIPNLRAAQGGVVFINSSAGLRAIPDVAAYSAGKHALRAAVDALREEVNGYGIRVLSIYPGRTETPMQHSILAQEHRTAPLGTLLCPEDIASMVLAAFKLPLTAEVTDITMRPMRKL